MNVDKDTLNAIQRVLEADSDDFISLAKLAELDPKMDFRGADLRGVDFGRSDLSGFDFTSADLRGADFRRASVAGAIFTDANSSGTLWPEGAPLAQTTYGPFHRLRSPTQTRQTADLQEKTGIIVGRRPRWSQFPSVQAYIGPLPSDAEGIEFFTTVKPTSSDHPYLVRWTTVDDKIAASISGKDNFASIPIVLTKKIYIE